MNNDYYKIVARLNNRIIPNFIKEREIEKIKQINHTESYNRHHIFSYIFDRVKSPKVLNLLGEKLSEEIIQNYSSISWFKFPSDIFNAKIVNGICNNPETFRDFLFFNIEDEVLKKFFSFLSEEQIDARLHDVFSSYFYSEKFIKVIKNIPKEYLPKLLSDIHIENAIDILLEENTIDNEIKTLLISLREKELINQIMSSSTSDKVLNQLLLTNISNEFTNNLIKNIDEKKLLNFMKSDKINDSVKKKIYESRKNDIDSIIIPSLQMRKPELREVKKLVQVKQSLH